MGATQSADIEGDVPPLLQPGTYTAIYAGHRGLVIFKTAKLEVLFQLLEHPAIVLSRWYRVTTYKGRISAPVQSDLVREIQAALNRRIRHDRMPLELLKNLPLLVEVKTVTTDKAQKELAPVNHYNVIACVKGPA